MKMFQLHSLSAFSSFLPNSTLTIVQMLCFLALLLHFWVAENSYLCIIICWQRWYKYLLYGLVITALFFLGTQSVIYLWQLSWGLMMHNSVGVVWRAAPVGGIWKVIRAINPKFFSVVCHEAVLQPVVMMPPACSFPPCVSLHQNNMTCLKYELIMWSLIAQSSSSK